MIHGFLVNYGWCENAFPIIASSQFYGDYLF